jgi:hypothetical protein
MLSKARTVDISFNIYSASCRNDQALQVLDLLLRLAIPGFATQIAQNILRDISYLPPSDVQVDKAYYFSAKR